MAFWDRVRGREETSEPPDTPIATAPDASAIAAALDNVEHLVSDPAVPAVIRARVFDIVALVRQTLPRLDLLGLGSYDAYSVVATATDYLPEAVASYLRLPRDWADSRPISDGKTALLVLVDQLDLLTSTMSQISHAANTADAAALILHGKFLTEKFGRHDSDPLGAP